MLCLSSRLVGVVSLVLLLGCGETRIGDAGAGSSEVVTRADGAWRLTSPEAPASDQNACWSPDGSFLVFTRFSRGYNLGPAHLFRVDLDADGEATGEPVQLTSGDFDDVNVPFGCFQAGTGRVVFASDREDANDLWTIDSLSADEGGQRLSAHGELPVWIEPVFSPDGQRIAFESDLEVEGEEGQRASIWTLDVGSSEPRLLVGDGDVSDDRLPSWSPDGARILYQHRDARQEDSLDRWEAWVVPAEGGDPENVSGRTTMDGDRGPDTDLSWTPDGRFILSSANHAGIPHPSIFLLPFDGGEVIRVTSDGQHEDGAPCASPDGRFVAFESHQTEDEDSPSALWAIELPAAARP